MRLRPPVSVCLEEWQPTYRQRHRLHSMISWANNAICFVVWAELDTVAAVALFLKCIPLEVTNRCPTSNLLLLQVLHNGSCSVVSLLVFVVWPFAECVPWRACFRLIVDCIRNRVTGCGLCYPQSYFDFVCDSLPPPKFAPWNICHVLFYLYFWFFVDSLVPSLCVHSDVCFSCRSVRCILLSTRTDYVLL